MHAFTMQLLIQKKAENLHPIITKRIAGKRPPYTENMIRQKKIGGVKKASSGPNATIMLITPSS